MRVLVACEYSGAVRDAFAALGHDAMSCDLLPTEAPGNHYQGDIRDVIHAQWDLMIAFPPCTHLCVFGARHFEQKVLDGRQNQGVSFFMEMTKVDIPKWCIENPVGIMSKLYREPTQIIQPYYFGDEAQKTTCLWLKGLPKLAATNLVDKGEMVTSPSGKTMAKWYSNADAHTRSKTFPGIAKAMANQWGISQLELIA
jgi:hypothetical protein